MTPGITMRCAPELIDGKKGRARNESRPSLANLFLEQILKRRPRIVWPLAGRRRSLFLASHANLIDCAQIALVFLRNAFLYRLHAFKAASRIEVRALLARVQRKSALRTFPFPRTGHPLQHGAALGAARHSPRTRQIDWFGPQRMVPSRRSTLALRRRLLRRFRSARFSVVVLISRLTVFCQANLPKRWPYCPPDRTHPASGALSRRLLGHGSPRIFTDQTKAIWLFCVISVKIPANPWSMVFATNSGLATQD